MRSLGPRQRASLIYHYAVLGKVNSLTALAETYGLDLTASCPDTRQNILHTGLVENWPEVVKLAIRYQQLFLEHDIFGRTPQNLLDTLTSDDPRKMIVALSILWGFRFSHSSSLPQTQPVSGPTGFDISGLDFTVRAFLFLFFSTCFSHFFFSFFLSFFQERRKTQKGVKRSAIEIPAEEAPKRPKVAKSKFVVETGSQNPPPQAPTLPVEGAPHKSKNNSDSDSNTEDEDGEGNDSDAEFSARAEPKRKYTKASKEKKQRKLSGDDDDDDDDGGDDDGEDDDGDDGDSPRQMGRGNLVWHQVSSERAVKPSLPPGFRPKLTQHFVNNPISLEASEYETLDKGWILEHFKKSVHHRRNSDLILYVRHKETGMLIITCLSLLMERLKRPQRYLAHLINKGFKRVKFAKKSADKEIAPLAPFFGTIPHFVVTRPEYESFCGSLKVFYNCECLSLLLLCSSSSILFVCSFFPFFVVNRKESDIEPVPQELKPVAGTKIIFPPPPTHVAGSRKYSFSPNHVVSTSTFTTATVPNPTTAPTVATATVTAMMTEPSVPSSASSHSAQKTVSTATISGTA